MQLVHGHVPSEWLDLLDSELLDYVGPLLVLNPELKLPKDSIDC